MENIVKMLRRYCTVGRSVGRWLKNELYDPIRKNQSVESAGVAFVK